MKKRCNICGAIHVSIPENARWIKSGDPLDGAYWECQCGSMMFVPFRKNDVQDRLIQISRDLADLHVDMEAMPRSQPVLIAIYEAVQAMIRAQESFKKYLKE